MGDHLIEIKNESARSLLHGLNSTSVDLKKISEVAKDAISTGNNSVAFLQQAEEKGIFYRLINMGEIRRNILATVDSSNKMIQVNTALTAMIYDQTIQLKDAQGRLHDLEDKSSRQHDKTMAFQEKLDEIISFRLGKIENSIEALGGLDIKEKVIALGASISSLKDDQSSEIINRMASIDNLNTKICSQDDYYKVEFEKRDRAITSSRIGLTQIITKKSKETQASIDLLRKQFRANIGITTTTLLILGIVGMLYLSKKIMSDPAATECAKTPSCFVDWLIR